MVIAGGTATLLGPIVGAALVIIMKDVASAYIERWNFVLGAIFVLIVVFMPEGLVPGSRTSGAGRAGCRHAHSAAEPARRPEVAAHKSFGGLRVTSPVNLPVEAGERRLIIGQNGAGKTTLFNLITGELRAGLPAASLLFGRDITRLAGTAARASWAGAHLPDHHAVPQARRCCATSRCRCSACRRCAGTRSCG